MNPLSIRATIDILRSIDSSTFTGSYQALGTPVANSVRIMKFVNNSNQDVTISIDGVNDYEILPATSYFVIDFSANRETGNAWELPSNTQFYVKGTAGTGSVYLSIYYAN